MVFSAGLHAGFPNVSFRMDSERGDRINAFLIAPHVFFLKRTLLYILVCYFFYFIFYFLYILLYIGTLLYYTHFHRKDMPTAFSPLGGLSCPDKKKKESWEIRKCQESV